MKNGDDFKLLRGFADRQTDKRTNEQTFVNVESLSRPKKNHDQNFVIFQQKKKIQERTILFNSSHCLLFVFAHNKNTDVKLGVSNCFYVLPHVGIKDGHYNYHHKPLPFIVCHKLKCPSLGHCSLIIKILGFVILFNTTQQSCLGQKDAHLLHI